MALLRKTWTNFKSQPDIWFFYGFLFTLPLTIRKIIYLLPLNGKFNEYSSAYLYLSDIFLFLAIIAWVFIILRNNNTFLSILTSRQHPSYKKLFHAEHLFPILLPLFLFVIWAIISINWSGNTAIAVFKAVKIFELALLFLFLKLNTHCSTWNNLANFLKIIVFGGLFSSIIGIYQFIIQHSIGLIWLKESIINRDAPYIAKIVLHGKPFIRAYGLFPHPNILGGYLVLSILATLAYFKLFHVEHSNRSRLIYWLVSSIQFIALILTFSKTALLALAIALSYTLTQLIVPRGTTLNKFRMRLFHVEQLRKLITQREAVLLSLILLISFFIINPDIKSFLITPAKDRILFAEIYSSMIVTHPFIGFGIGQSVIEMTNFLHIKTIDWQLQPVHNIFMLMWTELGMVGLGLFIILLYKLFHVEQKIEPVINIECSTWNKSHCEVYDPIRNVPRGTKSDKLNLTVLFKGVLVGFIIIMLFDHYLWDIQQGELILWLVMGIIASLNYDTLDI